MTAGYFLLVERNLKLMTSDTSALRLWLVQTFVFPDEIERESTGLLHILYLCRSNFRSQDKK